MVYWELLTSDGILKVAVPVEALTPEVKVMPLPGVTLLPCCNLIVTVPEDGFVQVMVSGWPAVTWRPPLGMLIALFEPCAAARAAQKARTRGAQGRIFEY